MKQLLDAKARRRCRRNRAAAALGLTLRVGRPVPTKTESVASLAVAERHPNGTCSATVGKSRDRGIRALNRSSCWPLTNYSSEVVEMGLRESPPRSYPDQMHAHGR